MRRILSGKLGFCVKLLAVYGLVMLPWLGLRDAYADVFRAVGGRVFATFGSGVETKFRPAERPDVTKDTEVILLNHNAPRIRGGVVAGRMGSSSRYTGFVPTVFFVALVLATPVPWRRRGLALLLGLVLLHLFIWLRLSVSLVNALSDDNAIRAFDLGPAVKGIVNFIVVRIWGSVLTCSYLVPTLIWVLVTIRRSDWEKLRIFGEDVLSGDRLGEKRNRQGSRKRLDEAGG